ncbi:MAG: DNA polymerase III subunit delta [Lachnospiraceae bacterium]|nr:DNA polymerase III subunit delta [Lachnospiraceae bacterium]
MNTINKDIESGTIKQFYLLYGEEDYLKKQYRDKLVEALVDPKDTMNLNYFWGNRTDVREVCDIGETLPFFSEHRVIILEDTGWFKKTPDKLETYLNSLPESTYLLFVEKEVDKRSKMFKWIGKSGYATRLDTPDEKMLITWMSGLCKKEGKKIEDQAIFYFVEHVGTDMMLLRNELEKVFCFMLERETVTVNDIKEVCVSQAMDKIFDMLDAIGTHNKDKALLLYHDLLALKEPAMRVLYMLTRHYHILMQVKGLVDEGKDNKAIASLCKVPPFSVKKYATQAQHYSYYGLCDMVEQCQMTEQKIKTGNVQDVVGVELLIVEFSKG